MKIRTVLLLLFLACQGFAQVSVGPKHVGVPGYFKKGELERFKNTETIFVLSSVYDRAEYERILRDSWDVTPYRIIDLHNFDIYN